MRRSCNDERDKLAVGGRHRRLHDTHYSMAFSPTGGEWIRLLSFSVIEQNWGRIQGDVFLVETWEVKVGVGQDLINKLICLPSGNRRLPLNKHSIKLTIIDSPGDQGNNAIIRITSYWQH